VKSSFLRIPLFPLNIVLIPGEVIPLHIFEDRYKKMIKDCIAGKKKFGIVNKNKNKTAVFGCTAKVEEIISRYDNGSYDVIVKGFERFEIKDKYNELGLWFGDVVLIENETPSNKNRSLLNKTRDKYLKVLIANKLMNNVETEISKNISFDFCQFINLNISLKQSFIEMRNEKERLLFLNSVFDRVLKVNKILSSKKPPKHFD
tara:strand:- start:7496 stop:8104 length:609 start_codon:yes stop_codon:yes gene_type:complete